jgi:hypothetical protein
MSRTRRRRLIPPRRPARCPVCRLPWCSRVLLEMALKEADSLALLAHRFGLTRTTLRQHMIHCER